MAYEPDMLLVRLRTLGRQGARSAVLVSLTGEVKDGDGAVLDSYLTAARAGGGDVVVDVGAVTYLSEPAARIVERFARLQAAEDRRVVVAGASPEVRTVLAATTGGSGLRHTAGVAPAVAVTRGLAVADRVDGADAADGADGTGIRPADREGSPPPRRPVRSMAVVRRAQQMLVRRYALDGPEAALGLLRASSRCHDVALGPLAAAVLDTPPPDTGAPRWFPGSGGAAAPPLPFAPALDGSTARRSETVAALRDAACHVTQTGMGNVQLTARGGAALRLEAHRGFSAEFTDFFDVVRDDTSACGRALLDGMRVITAEVATDQVFDDDARRVMLTAGIRSVQSTPLRGASGRTVGMVSTHYRLSHRVHSTTELRVLDTLAAQAGAWLEWHEHTALVSALEHLHDLALRGDPGGTRAHAAPA